MPGLLYSARPAVKGCADAAALRPRAATGQDLTLRILFAAEPVDEREVRDRIEAALSQGTDWCQRFVDRLVVTRDRRLAYIIWNRRIIDSRPGNNPWQWVPYHGSNPHDHHVHLSVMAAPSCDDTRPWALPGMTGPSPQPTPQGGPVSIWDRREQAWGGGVTDDQNNPYDLFEFGKRNNVEIRQARVEIAHLTDLVQTLLAEVAALKQAP